LQTQAGLDSQGMLVIAIGNPTKVPVTAIGFAVEYVDSQGRTRSLQRTLSGTLGAGQQTRIETGLGPFQGENQYRVGLTSAHISE
jgi:hypothetical protein